MFMLKILDEMAYLRILQIIKKRPLDINIETINMCPLKCVFCCNRVYNREPVVMDNMLFEDIIKQYCDMGGGALGLSSMQSDFFSDPLLMDRMRIIKKFKKKYKEKLWVYITTPLLSLKKYSDKELQYILCLFDCLQISVEGYDRESYQNMAGVNGFDIVKEQLERVRKITERNSLKIRIDIYFRTYDKAKLKASEIYREMKRVFNIYDVKDTFFSWFGTIKQEDLPRGAKVVFKYNEGKKINCANANVSLTVMADGKVVGCGCIDWLGKYIIGDCRKNSLEEIWRSPEAVKFRTAFEKGKLPSICHECGLYSPITNMKNKKFLNYTPTNGLFYLQK